MQYPARVSCCAALLFFFAANLKVNAGGDLLLSPTRLDAIEYINSVESQPALLSEQKTEITSASKEERTRTLSGSIRLVAVLAIDGRDEVRQDAADFMVEMFRNPAITLRASGTPLQPDAEDHLLTLIAGLGELGSQPAVRCLIDGTRLDYWKEEAKPNSDQKYWFYAAMERLVEGSFHHVYFLQSQFTEAHQRVDELRNADPANPDNMILKNWLASYDNGNFPQTVALTLGLQPVRSIYPQTVPFFIHPAVYVYLQQQSFVLEWEQMK